LYTTISTASVRFPGPTTAISSSFSACSESGFRPIDQASGYSKLNVLPSKTYVVKPGPVGVELVVAPPGLVEGWALVSVAAADPPPLH
jgi:hypothetical protein